MNTITLKTSKNEWLAMGEGFLTNGSFMSNSLLLRVYRIFDDSDNEMNVYIDERYVKMFDNFKLVTENFNNKQTIKILDGVDIIGLLMPVNRREYNNITV